MLNELAKRIHENAKEKGFWDEQKEVGTLLMLVVSELGEALESDRINHYTDERYTGANVIDTGQFEYYVKDTFEDEIADSIIRLLDLCHSKNIDIDWHIKAKMKYNESRERLHGKKY